MNGFDGKVAVITGAMHGIGACTAEMFRAAGAFVADIDMAPGAMAEGEYCRSPGTQGIR